MIQPLSPARRLAAAWSPSAWGGEETAPMGAQTAVEPGEPPRLPMLSFGNDKGFSLRCLPGGGEDFADVRSVAMRPGGQEAMQPRSKAASTT